MAVFVVAPISSVGASHADGTYDLPVWFRWEKSVLDVIIVPPNHGQIINGDGVLNGGNPSELTPFNSYLAAIEASVADWDRGIEMFAPEWLRSRLVTNVFVAGRDQIPTDVLTNPEVVIVTDETKANILGLAFSTRPCVVDNSKFFIQSFTYEDMYNINSQEYGHCLGLEHVVDNHPEHDPMAGIYVDGVGAKEGHLHCVSNLDVLGLTAVFGRLFDQPSPDSVSVPVDAYGTTCAPPTGTDSSTPTPAPSDATVGPTPAPSSTMTPTPTPTPAPSGSPEPNETYQQSMTFELRRHLVARGAVEAAEAADHCYAGVRVEIQRRRATSWQEVATSVTDGDGSFRTRIPDRAGRYRGLVEPQRSERGDCAGAVSTMRRHTH